MDIPIIFAVRKQSQRCSNKILRPFHNRESLLQIAAKKFEGSSLTFIAAHEPEFKVIADQYKIGFIQRTLQSALSEKALEIHDYLTGVNHKYVCLINTCCPLLKASTVEKAIEAFKSDPSILSMFSVTESYDIIFNNNEKLINSDKVLNSKIRLPSFIGNNAFVIFNIEKFLKNGFYWNYEVNDPSLFKTSKTEAVDIDTVEDFEIAQILYERHCDK